MMRAEQDSIGEIQVPAHAWWGSQTQRSLENFPIGRQRMPEAVIKSLIFIKAAAAVANFHQDSIPEKVKDAIVSASHRILNDWESYKDQFPLVIWQTGSGTQSNMNCNEVIAKIANAVIDGSMKPKPGYSTVHPNDHVNRSQSSNDTFPAAMHLAAVQEVQKHLLPALKAMEESIGCKAKEWNDLIKIGRTHLQDATPISLGQEFSCYKSQLSSCTRDVELATENLLALPLGGTAVGTGINAKRDLMHWW